MSFTSLSGARIPHEAIRTVDVAGFSLPGGTHAASADIGHSVGWRITAGPTGTLNKALEPEGTSVVQHAWLSSSNVPITQAPDGYTPYADALAANYLVRATLVSGSAPSTGGLNTWLPLSVGRSWFVNAGGSPGEVSTSTILLEIAEDISVEVPGPVLASGNYTMTATRV